MTRLHHLFISLAALSVAVAACSSESDDKTPADDSSTGGTTSTGGSSGSGGAAEPAPKVCGGVECDPVPPELGQYGVSSCCTATADECGLQTPVTEGCLEPDQPGGIDYTCPIYELPTGMAMPGCCTPAGTCGALDSTMGLGCIPNEDLGEASQDCSYDPNNDCTAIAELPCDGPEDCPGSQQCCGRYAGSGYDLFGCFDSCETAGGDAGGRYFALCHEDSHCLDGSQCLTSIYLPSSLARCYDTGDAPAANAAPDPGAVNCGDAVCGSDEQCCVPTPGDSFCAPAGGDCTCKPKTADANADAGADAGADSGSAQSDAGADASASDAAAG